MNIFENYKASKYFIDISNGLSDKEKERWSSAVKAKFLVKVTSDDELENYQITIKDLDELIERLDISNLSS